jgi:hypothetical protein
VAVTVINREDVPADLPPGVYCCRLDESSSLIGPAGFRARFITPPQVHRPGTGCCLIQLMKHEEGAAGGT